jgi:hypothetical protein
VERFATCCLTCSAVRPRAEGFCARRCLMTTKTKRPVAKPQTDVRPHSPRAENDVGQRERLELELRILIGVQFVGIIPLGSHASASTRRGWRVPKLERERERGVSVARNGWGTRRGACTMLCSRRVNGGFCPHRRPVSSPAVSYFSRWNHATREAPRAVFWTRGTSERSSTPR